MPHPALRPRWLVGHVIVAVLVVSFVALGVWQLRRLGERQSENAVVRARLAEPTVPVETLLPASPPSGAVGSGAAALENRTVTATGVFEADREVLVRGRTDEAGTSGFWDVMPLRLADGRAVIVVRGWIPFEVGDSLVRPVAAVAPPSGTVTVTGTLQPSQTRAIFGASDPPTGTLGEMARVDVGRLAKQVPDVVPGVWVQQQSQAPANTGPLPKPIPVPELDDGPHLSYALQWFAFAAVFGVGWVLLVRRSVLRPKAARRSTGRSTGPPSSVEDSRSPADVNSGA